MPVVNPYYEPTAGNRAAVEPLKNVSQETSCRLHARKVSVSPGWDVIVAGGGPAGCAAAVAAAREGARTLLVEGTWALGGMGTSGLVPALCPFTDGKRIIYGGIAERVLKACKAALPNHPRDRNDWVPINPEALKRTYDALVHQYGARVLFGVNVAGVETDGAGRVARLIAASKAGLTAFEGTAIVDATGDGDVAAWAGAGFEKGSADGDLQPATHCFILANVDLNELAKVGLRQDPLNRILESGKYPLIVDRHLCYSAIGPGTVGFNAGHVWGVDNTEPESVTMAAFKGREIALQFRNALAEAVPAAFKDAYLVSTGAMVGVRETRRITGDYVLVMDDFAGRKSFDDEICRNAYFIDVHPEKHASVAGVDPGKVGFRLNPGESHGVPYRCLTPKGLVNVLVAGRCISSDRPVQGSVRVMPVCLATGEAAGIAAALAARCGGDVRGFDVQRLRMRLREEGAYLP
ncbi:MAG: FAD-dependent oxidoreductase [Lentisphaerae bacterium]|nr:FAD-dependent oxidoreductase [Lentisphaerota bacterium]